MEQAAGRLDGLTVVLLGTVRCRPLSFCSERVVKKFKNILVGVDLSQGDQLVSDELSPPGVEAIERALWLAKVNSARLHFFYALDVSAAARRLIGETEGLEQTVLDRANIVLGKLVERAGAEGVAADFEVRFGKSWLEMIRAVVSGNHDLVVAGTRHLSAIRGFLLGSTGVKLLRFCPCPVWITEPQSQPDLTSILVAHCLQPAGDLAMELGCEMAQLQDAQLHVLHSLDFPELDRLDSVVPEPLAEDVVAHRAEAERHINAQLSKYEFARAPRVHIATDPPDVVVMKLVDALQVELLVMGTITRAGISGFFLGDTAERLLPQISCSLLAVKPPDFHSPVSM